LLLCGKKIDLPALPQSKSLVTADEHNKMIENAQKSINGDLPVPTIAQRPSSRGGMAFDMTFEGMFRNGAPRLNVYHAEFL
jgi:hypothetical protein